MLILALPVARKKNYYTPLYLIDASRKNTHTQFLSETQRISWQNTRLLCCAEWNTRITFMFLAKNNLLFVVDFLYFALIQPIDLGYTSIH